MFRAWIAQDQAILSAIQSSLGEGVAGLVLFASSSHEVWDILESSFSSQSTAQSMAIRAKLGETRKDNDTVTTFYNKIKKLADTLASIGEPLRDSEFTSFILAGLDSDYDSLAEVINERKEPLRPQELYSRLLATEQRLNARRPDVSIDSSFNAVYRGKGGGRGPSASSSGGGGKSGGGGAPSTQQQQAPRSGAPVVVVDGRACACCTTCGAAQPCQLCGLPRHVASRCHRRFKTDFLGLGNNGKGNERQVNMAQQGHTPSYPVDPSWYMDTGATTHVTNELGKLTVQQPYRGHDKVHTANGVGMRISHVGQASLLTNTSRTLHLRNVLRVPTVARNLLSVPKLTQDNNVFCEFHPFHLFVKDRATRNILLRGRYRHGLYALDAPTDVPAPAAAFQVFSGVRVSPSLWHSRLGHPASPIVRHVLHRHELPSESSNKDAAVYDACQQGKSHQLPFSVSTHIVKTPLELVFSDVWGPAQLSVSGHEYYVSFIDAYSRFTWIYLLKHKSDVFNVFLQFQAHVERLLDHKIIHVQSDWG